MTDLGRVRCWELLGSVGRGRSVSLGCRSTTPDVVPVLYTAGDGAVSVRAVGRGGFAHVPDGSLVALALDHLDLWGGPDWQVTVVGRCRRPSRAADPSSAGAVWSTDRPVDEDVLLDVTRVVGREMSGLSTGSRVRPVVHLPAPG